MSPASGNRHHLFAKLETRPREIDAVVYDVLSIEGELEIQHDDAVVGYVDGLLRLHVELELVVTRIWVSEEPNQDLDLVHGSRRCLERQNGALGTVTEEAVRQSIVRELAVENDDFVAVEDLRIGFVDDDDVDVGVRGDVGWDGRGRLFAV